MAIGSDRSSVLSREECEKGLLLLFPTELLLPHVIRTSGVRPRAVGSVPSSPEAALPTQCLGPLCSSSPPEPSQAAAQNTELSTEGAAIEELETHVPIHYLSQGDASLSEIGRNS